MSSYADLREACCAANRRLPELGLVDLTFGNVSLASPDKMAIAIKPSGVDYAKLTPGDIVIVLSYCAVTEEEARTHRPTVVHVDSSNRIARR